MKNRTIKQLLGITLCLLFATGSVYAASGGQGTPSQGSGGQGAPSGSSQNITPMIENPLGGDIDSLSDLFKAIVNNILIPIGSVVAVIAFIVTGFMFVTAQGKPEKLDTAKRALLYTAVGTAILLGASVIITVLTNTIESLRG